jgi:iron complex outermembrane receptor protein
VANDRLTYSNTFLQLNTFRGVRSGTPYRNTSNQGSVRFNIAPGMSVTGRLWYANHDLTSTESPTFTAAVLANSAAGAVVPAVALPIGQLALFETGQPFNAGNATFIPNQIDPDGRRKGNFFSGGVTFDHRIASNTAYRITVQNVATKRTYIDGPLGPGSSEPATETRGNFNGYTTNLKAEIDRRAGRYNRLTAGYEFESERYASFGGATYDLAASGSIALKQRSHAFYVQDQVSLMNGQLQLTAAGRAQAFNLLAPTFGGFSNPYAAVSAVSPPTAYTGDGAVAYFVKSRGTKFRAHVGNSFRAPSGYERYGGGGGFYYGDPAIRPERAVAVDGGIDRWFHGSKIQLSGTVFYTHLQEVIRFANSLPSDDAFGRSFGYANGGGGIARGAELSGRFAPTSRTSMDLSYTFTNSDSKTPTIAGTAYHESLGVSRHKTSFAITQSLGRMTVAYDMTALSDYSQALFGGGTRRFVFSGPITGDVAVRYRVPAEKPVEFFVKVNNVFNQRPFEDGFVGPKAWAVAGVRWFY